MTTQTLGNLLYRLVTRASDALFNQGELAQLTYEAFFGVANNVGANDAESIEVSFPIGYRPDKTSILGTRKYTKHEVFPTKQDTERDRKSGHVARAPASC